MNDEPPRDCVYLVIVCWEHWEELKGNSWIGNVGHRSDGIKQM